MSNIQIFKGNQFQKKQKFEDFTKLNISEFQKKKNVKNSKMQKIKHYLSILFIGKHQIPFPSWDASCYFTWTGPIGVGLATGYDAVRGYRANPNASFAQKMKNIKHT